MSDSIRQRAGYLRDAVFAANDGVITTFAVVAGSAGASLDASVVLILGFANLFADGFSMASGVYLGVKSEIEFEKSEGQNGMRGELPIKSGIVTFVAFNTAGIISLLPFLFRMNSAFEISAILVGVSLFGVGFLKSFYTKKNFFKSGIEVVVIGGFAALVAYAIGFLVHKYAA